MVIFNTCYNVQFAIVCAHTHEQISHEIDIQYET